MKTNPESPEIGWETVVDFTEGGKKTGISVEEALRILKDMH